MNLHTLAENKEHGWWWWLLICYAWKWKFLSIPSGILLSSTESCNEVLVQIIFSGMNTTICCDNYTYNNTTLLEKVGQAASKWRRLTFFVGGWWDMSKYYKYITLDILFSSNHNIHKSLCGLCFWASDPLIDRFYK